MQPLDYLHLQMKLEGIGFDDAGRLIPLYDGVNESPYFVFAKCVDEKSAQYFPLSLAPEIQAEIKQRASNLAFPDVQPVVELLNRQKIAVKVGHFKTYRFPENFRSFETVFATAFSKDDARIISFRFGGMADRVYAVEQAGVILSACVSVRENEFCAECWVLTAPEQRRKGLGGAVVSLWAAEIFRAGKIPFYSHAITNIPSARLANRLGLSPIYEELVLAQ